MKASNRLSKVHSKVIHDACVPCFGTLAHGDDRLTLTTYAPSISHPVPPNPEGI
jgi:hypothetical protein